MAEKPNVIEVLLAYYRAERDERFAALSGCPHDRKDVPGVGDPKLCPYCRDQVYAGSASWDERQIQQDLEEAVVEIERRQGISPLLSVTRRLGQLHRDASGLLLTYAPKERR